MIEMSLNGSGIRDVARVLRVSPSTVIREIKKGPPLQQVNHKLLETLHPKQVEVEVILVTEIEDQVIEEAELDEMWSFIGRKRNQRWLWHALDRRSGQVLAYVFGRRKDEVFLELKQLLEGFEIQKFCSDGWGAYERHLCPEVHEVIVFLNRA